MNVRKFLVVSLPATRYVRSESVLVVLVRRSAGSWLVTVAEAGIGLIVATGQHGVGLVVLNHPNRQSMISFGWW
jgi:hypothetical protein